ncbi:MAG TPA: hypothetical protein VE756_04675 [Burkholderiales bacterium]|nr:hypothetical protein [Burkholderiales bacterium]
MPDTVTANGEGCVELGSVIREALYVSTARTFARFEIAPEESDDVPELGESLSTYQALKKR